MLGHDKEEAVKQILKNRARIDPWSLWIWTTIGGAIVSRSNTDDRPLRRFDSSAEAVRWVMSLRADGTKRVRCL